LTAPENGPATATIDLGIHRLTFRIEQGGLLALHVTGPSPGWGCSVNSVKLVEFAEQLSEVAHASMAHPNYRGPYPVRHKPGWIHLGSHADFTSTPDGDIRCESWAADPDRRPHRCKLNASHSSQGWACDFVPEKPPAAIAESLAEYTGLPKCGHQRDSICFGCSNCAGCTAEHGPGCHHSGETS
jgi:hypothetical protein